MGRDAVATVLFDSTTFGANGDGPVGQAVEAVLAALAERGGLEPTDAAHVAALRILADAIDNDRHRAGVTSYGLARSIRQLTALLEPLRARSEPPPAPADDVDPLAAFAAALETSASHRS